LLSVLAVALLMAFSGCIGGQDPQAEAEIIDALTGSDDDEGAQDASADPAPPAAEPQEQAATEVLEASPEAAASEPKPIVPRTSYVLPKGSAVAAHSTSVPQGLDLKFSEQPQAPKSGDAVVQWPEPPAPPVIDTPVLTGPLVDAFKAWPISFSGGVEYALGCQDDGLDCAYFPLPAAAQGQEFTITFGAAVPAIAYFVDLYADGAYIATFGDTFTSDPIAGFSEGGHGTYTGIVPAGITEFRAYATGGADFVAHLVVGEPACTSDPYAIGSATAGLWATPFDSLDSPGAMWVYEETNGEPGLQRSDETYGTDCATADHWII
jgi:hypothetical protein